MAWMHKGIHTVRSFIPSYFCVRTARQQLCFLAMLLKSMSFVTAQVISPSVAGSSEASEWYLPSPDHAVLSVLQVLNAVYIKNWLTLRQTFGQWLGVVAEYTVDKLAEDSDDEKRVEKAEMAAERLQSAPRRSVLHPDVPSESHSICPAINTNSNPVVAVRLWLDHIVCSTQSSGLSARFACREMGDL